MGSHYELNEIWPPCCTIKKVPVLGLDKILHKETKNGPCMAKTCISTCGVVALVTSAVQLLACKSFTTCLFGTTDD